MLVIIIRVRCWMRVMLRSILQVFGWIPIPKFIWKYILGVLPNKYRINLANNFLSAVEEEDLVPELVQIILDKLEEKGYNVGKGNKFKNTEDEVNESMKNLPLLAPYKVYFMRWCERKRREFGLPI